MRVRLTVGQLAFVTLVVVTMPNRWVEGADGNIEFFEKRIRPVFIEHCAECHSAGKKVKGGLRLDTRAGWEQGGDSGPAVVPGKPDESLLIEALRHEGDVKMPPKGKLPAAVIRDFEQWVAGGALAPADKGAPGSRSPTGIDIEAGRRHWAYQPVTKRPVPTVHDSAWPLSDIDFFILARVEALSLSREEKPGDNEQRGKLARRTDVLAPEASRETLIRRLYFDLVGLPPTPEQIDEFVEDQSPDAWERLVDRLLASPQFAERWARHWFDVVRYAESLTLRGFILKEAWRYRDYVIDAFDRDFPYDQFLREQIAGDLLPSEVLEERQRRLVATTVFMLGNTNLEEQDKAQLEMDLVDEQLDLLGRGFLAQTITCARCHDHKFDPIPTRDYYALAGILKGVKALEHGNVSKWIEVPLPVAPAEEAVFTAQEQEVARVQRQLADARESLKKASDGTLVAGSGVLAAKDLPGVVVDDAQAKKVGQWQASQSVKPYIGDGYLHDIDDGKGEKTMTFVAELPEPGTYEVRLAYTAGANRSEKVPVTVFSADGEKTVDVNERTQPPIEGRFVSLGEYLFEKSGQSFVIVSNAGTKGHVIADAVQFLRRGTEPATGAGTAEVAKVPDEQAAKRNELQAAREAIQRLEAELQNLAADSPKRPMVMTVVERESPGDLFVHVRGSVHNKGPVVPRGFLEVATTGPGESIPAGESGRRQLADWIASPQNPMTARVIVNRVWHWLFGAGLVGTTDNFGTTGEAPSHPELLDHLAATFMEDGWSIKRLVRRVVTSRTYRLAAMESPEARQLDPENCLFAHRTRRRLDAESLRDAMLFVSGQLQTSRGGPTYPTNLAADYGFVDPVPRRSVYVPVFRNALPEIFEVFDFADPSLVTGNRATSTVAPQALFLMNHPFVHAQARHAAVRLLTSDHVDASARVEHVYRVCLGRAPTATEQRISLEFLASDRSTADRDEGEVWTELIKALFATLEFRYVD